MQKQIIISVAKKEELAHIFKLRHKVFVEEEGVSDSTDGLEIDKYDENATHFVIKENDDIIGTFRIFKNGNKLFRGLYRPPDDFDFERAVEISRLAVRKDKRGDLAVFLKIMRFVHLWARDSGYKYLCGTMRLKLYKFFKKRLQCDFEFASDIFYYHNKWPIIAFASPVEKNIDKFKQ